MSDTTHPPIPPGSKHIDSTGRCWQRFNEDGQLVCVCRLDDMPPWPQERFIIGAVFAAEWHDIAASKATREPEHDAALVNVCLWLGWRRKT